MRHYKEFNAKNYSFTVITKKEGVESPAPGKRKRKAIKYCNEVFTLDTENTALFIDIDGTIHPYRYEMNSDYYKNCQKIGVTYIWMISVKGDVYYGRYGHELKEFLGMISDAIKGAKFIVYVQNLSYDFAYLQNFLGMTNVFARKSRTPLRASVNKYNLTLKDSYCLNRTSLENVANEYMLPHKKLTGNMDYLKIRLPRTPLTDEEMAYCENDCLLLHDYITMKRKEYGMNIFSIPTTQTSEVRMALIEEIKEQAYNPRYAMKDWYADNARIAPDLKMFTMLCAAYSGGYVHANSRYVGRTIECVVSYDVTSMYPAMMISEYFPIGKWIKVNEKIEDIDSACYGYVMTVRMRNVQSIKNNTYISASKCDQKSLGRYILDNGRIHKCEDLTITMTEQDWEIIKESYHIGSVEVLSMHKCPKRKIPKPIAMLIAKLYAKKQALKAKKKRLEDTKKQDSAEYENVVVEYKYAKELLNGIYGCAVTKYVSDPVTYGKETPDEWDDIEEATEEELSDMLMYHNRRELIPYSIGVWTSAYARRTLWDMILKLDAYVIYSDTDSLKLSVDCKADIEAYNAKIRAKIDAACRFYGIPREVLAGLGEFDKDGEYDLFRTLGAKKYAVTEDGVVSIAVSGANKKKCAKVILPDLSNFTDGMEFNEAISGRTIRYYIDDQKPVTVEDYLGNTETIEDQKHGVCLQPTTYSLRDSLWTNDTFAQGSTRIENASNYFELWT